MSSGEGNPEPVRRDVASVVPAVLSATSVVPQCGGSDSWELVILDAVPPDGPTDGAAVEDIDGDGKTEVIITGYGAILWYRPSTSERSDRTWPLQCRRCARGYRRGRAQGNRYREAGSRYESGSFVGTSPARSRKIPGPSTSWTAKRGTIHTISFSATWMAMAGGSWWQTPCTGIIQRCLFTKCPPTPRTPGESKWCKRDTPRRVPRRETWMGMAKRKSSLALTGFPRLPPGLSPGSPG